MNSVADLLLTRQLTSVAGDVYRGIWQGTTNVALKKFKQDTRVEDFAREAAILKALHHPNIVQFLGLHTSAEGQHYIVTEFLSQGSLSSLLQEAKTKLSQSDLLAM